jgi:CheY-like chemotaxis protein
MNPEKPLAYIIEDDEDLSVIFSGALSSAGYETEALKNGTEALEQLQKAAPNLVLLDLHLPETSGVDILEYIRSEKHLAMTDVVVTTADARLAEQVRDNADFVLVKPITFSQLRDLTARLNPFNTED